jgi:hypothetical protein
VCLVRFASAETLTLAWDPPGSLPCLLPGETLVYELWERRSPHPAMLPVMALPWGTTQQSLRYAPLAPGEQVCWSLTTRQVREPGAVVLGDSAFAPLANDAAHTELCRTGPPGPGLRELPRTGWRVAVDSAAAGWPGRDAIDASIATFWHTPWTSTPLPHPHLLTITLPTPQVLAAVRYVPRQDGSTSGNLVDYTIEVQPSGGKRWSTVARGTHADPTGALLVSLAGGPAVNAVRLRSRSAVGGVSWVNAADIALFVLEKTPE